MTVEVKITSQVIGYSITACVYERRSFSCMGGKEKRVFRCNLLYNIAYIASVNQERRTRKSEFGNGKATAAW